MRRSALETKTLLLSPRILLAFPRRRIETSLSPSPPLEFVLQTLETLCSPKKLAVSSGSDSVRRSMVFRTGWRSWGGRWISGLLPSKMDREELILPRISEAGGDRFRILRSNRDLQSDWEVDLAKNLEEYLLKICSGENSSDQDHSLHSVNFAEAALLLQGSVQVYSRKVAYLYSLVFHALEFLSQKSLGSVLSEQAKLYSSWSTNISSWSCLGLEELEGQRRDRR